MKITPNDLKFARYAWITGALMSLGEKLFTDGILTIEEVKDTVLLFTVGYVWLSYFKLRKERKTIEVDS